jgi:hypothetical protein
MTTPKRVLIPQIYQKMLTEHISDLPKCCSSLLKWEF